MTTRANTKASTDEDADVKAIDEAGTELDQSGLYEPGVPGSAPHAASASTVGELTQVDVPEGVNPSEVAAALLASAEDLGLHVGVVQAFNGSFVAPADVVDNASLPEPPKATAKHTAKS